MLDKSVDEIVAGALDKKGADRILYTIKIMNEKQLIKDEINEILSIILNSIDKDSFDEAVNSLLNSDDNIAEIAIPILLYFQSVKEYYQ